MGRKNHLWPAGTIGADGVLVSRCQNCGMTQRSDYYAQNGRVYAVIQWAAPDGRLLAIRPVVDRMAPTSAPPLEDAFSGVLIAGSPECPKSVDAWSTGLPRQRDGVGAGSSVDLTCGPEHH